MRPKIAKQVDIITNEVTTGYSIIATIDGENWFNIGKAHRGIVTFNDKADNLLFDHSHVQRMMYEYKETLEWDDRP